MKTYKRKVLAIDPTLHYDAYDHIAGRNPITNPNYTRDYGELNLPRRKDETKRLTFLTGGDINLQQPKQPIKKQTFGDAFKTAKNAGKKTFMFEGKEFTTETKDEKVSKPVQKDTTKVTQPVKQKTTSGDNPFYNNHGYTQYNWSKDLADMVYDTLQKDTAYIHFRPIDIAHVIGDESSFDRYARGKYTTTDAKGNKVTKLKSFVGPFQQDKARFQIINPTRGASRWQEYADKKREDQYIRNDIVDYLRSQDKRITSERDKMTYGRLKINQYAPNSRLDDVVSDKVWDNNVVHEIELGRLSKKLQKGKATYRDLMKSYDANNKW